MAKRPPGCSAMVVSDKSYSFTIRAKIHRRSCLRRSGSQTPPFPLVEHADWAAPNVAWPEVTPVEQAKYWGLPLLPPGGVIPPGPANSGTSEPRCVYSTCHVTHWLGIYSKATW